MTTYIDIENWGKKTFPDDTPSRKALVNMGKSGMIYPAPRKISGKWRVQNDAQLTDKRVEMAINDPVSEIDDIIVQKIFSAGTLN